MLLLLCVVAAVVVVIVCGQFTGFDAWFRRVEALGGLESDDASLAKTIEDPKQLAEAWRRQILPISEAFGHALHLREDLLYIESTFFSAGVLLQRSNADNEEGLEGSCR